MEVRMIPKITLSLFAASVTLSAAENTIIIEHADAQATATFKLGKIQSPRRNDAAAKAAFTLADGQRDNNGGDLGVLNDGLVPTEEDQPSANFFFRGGSQGGRIAADLGSIINVAAVCSYSWHPGGRGPQVYTLYAATGTNAGFVAAPAKSADPATSGWQLIAKVDTRKAADQVGGQYAVCVTNATATLGAFRYFLWDVQPTDSNDPFGQTFYSEIDIVSATPAAEPESSSAAVDLSQHRKVVQVEGDVEITIDTSETPDLTEWSNTNLVPMVTEWYPKIVAMLPSEGYTAPKRVSIIIDKDMSGVAETDGTRIKCAANWMRRELRGEAVGAVLHELVHVVQQYGRARRNYPSATRTPGWVTEGIPDYIRWYIYEPQTHGADIAPRNIERARYDASYRVSANFLNWVVVNHDKDLVRKLNAAARESKYSEDLWRDWTGQTVQELGDKWKASLTAKSPAPVQP